MQIKDEIHKIYEEIYRIMDRTWVKYYRKKKFKGRFNNKPEYNKFYLKLRQGLVKMPKYKKLLSLEMKVNYLSQVLRKLCKGKMNYPDTILGKVKWTNRKPTGFLKASLKKQQK